MREYLFQVAGVSGKKPERRAGGRPAAAPMTTEKKMMETSDPATASETVVHRGGDEKTLKRSQISCCFIFY